MHTHLGHRNTLRKHLSLALSLNQWINKYIYTYNYTHTCIHILDTHVYLASSQGPRAPPLRAQRVGAGQSLPAHWYVIRLVVFNICSISINMSGYVFFVKHILHLALPKMPPRATASGVEDRAPHLRTSSSCVPRPPSSPEYAYTRMHTY